MDNSIIPKREKPRMLKLGVLWFCWTAPEDCEAGLTALEAYNDWLSRVDWCKMRPKRPKDAHDRHPQR